MKRFILLVCILGSCFAALSQGQTYFNEPAPAPFSGKRAGDLKIRKEPRFTLTLHGGYAVALGSTFKFYPDDITSIAVRMPEGGPASKTVSSKAAGKGLGEGFRYGGGLSYVINDFINIGIDFDYFNSTISKARDSSYQESSGGTVSDKKFNQRYTISYNARLLTITPNITFKAISRPGFFIYNKVGAIITFRPNSIQREMQQDQWTTVWQGFSKDSSSASAKRYEWGIQNPAFGFMGAIGAQVKLMERVRAFGEIQFSHILFVVRNRVLTSYTVDGREMVNTLGVSQRQTDFKKTLTNDEWNVDPDKPTLAITQRFPLTYVGLQLGLAYRF